MKICVVILLFCLTGCVPVYETEFPFIDLRPVIEGNIRTISLEELADEDRIVHFETVESSLFRFGTDALYENGFFIVRGNKCILLFDGDGSFIRDIARRGEGPDEYVSDDFIFLEDGLFHIYDSGKGYIQSFDLYGNYKDRYPLHRTLTGLYPLGDSTYIAYIAKIRGNEPNKFVLFDRTGSMLKTYPYKEQEHYNVYVTVWNEGAFFEGDNNLNFKEIFNDTVYAIQDFRIIPRFRFELGEYKAKTNARANITNPRDNIYENMQPVFINGESRRYIFLSLKKLWVVYDKQKETLRSLVLKEEEDMDQSLRFIKYEDNFYLIVEKSHHYKDNNPVYHFYRIRE